MRSLASFLAESDPDVMALGEIDAGDALALATRFDRQWAYRGGQALLWNARVTAHEVHDLYLPVAPLAFERRGLLRIDGECDAAPLALFATQFGSDRNNVREMRFARTHARTAPSLAMMFVTSPLGRIGFSDLGYEAMEEHDTSDQVEIAARGFHLERLRSGVVGGGIGAALLVRARRLTV
jgi:hypothetical protein